MQSAALAPLLRHPLHGVVRIEVEHVRGRRFRALVLLEFVVAILLSFILVPLALLLVIFGEGGGELPTPSFESLGSRLWVYWREMRVRLVDAQGHVVQAAQAVVESMDEGDRMLGQVLAHAHGGRVAVVERMSGGVVSAVWFGGRPLMLGPEAVDEARAWRVLQHEGVELVDDGAGRCAITLSKPAPSRIGSAVNFTVLLPLYAWTAWGREQLAAYWAAALGHGTIVRFEVDAHSVSYRRTRGPKELANVRVDRADLLGIGHAPVLTPAPRVFVRGPFLRLQTAASAVVLDVERNADIGRALRDALVGAAHRLWSGLSQSGAPAHCPYCATLYPYAPGASCPNCGAAPSALHGLAAPSR